MTAEIDRQEMQSYLLGTLDEDRRTQFEERILAEPGVYEELLIAEEELIDQYLAGDLSERERQQFENHFLITAERQTNLRFGQHLQRCVNSHIALTETEEAPIPVQQSARVSEFTDNYSFRLIE